LNGSDKKNHGKFIVGLTGGFGSGKTAAANLFEELGAFVVDSDRIARETFLKGSEPYPALARLFEGRDVQDAKGLNRKKIAAIVFCEPKFLAKLEAIVHPYVFQRVEEEIFEAADKLVLVEVPLLYESGFQTFCDRVIVVAARPEAVRRRLEEKGFSASEIEARGKAQIPLEEKIKKADEVIENSGNLKETRRQVEKIWKKLQFLLKEKGEKTRQCQEKE